MNYQVTIQANQHPLLINQVERIEAGETKTHVVTASTLSTLRIQEAKGIITLSSINETTAALTIQDSTGSGGGSVQIVEVIKEVIKEVEVEVPVDRPIEVVKTVHEIKEIPIEKKVYIPEEITTDTRTYFSFDELELNSTADSAETFLNPENAVSSAYISSSQTILAYSPIIGKHVLHNQANRSSVSISETGALSTSNLNAASMTNGSATYNRAVIEDAERNIMMKVNARAVGFFQINPETGAATKLGETLLNITTSESSTYVFAAIVREGKLYLHVNYQLSCIDIETMEIEYTSTAPLARSTTYQANSYYMISEVDGIMITNSGLIFDIHTGEIFFSIPAATWNTQSTNPIAELFQINIDEYRIYTSSTASSVTHNLYYFEIKWDREAKTGTVETKIAKLFEGMEDTIPAASYTKLTRITNTVGFKDFDEGLLLLSQDGLTVAYTTKYATTPEIIRQAKVTDLGNVVNEIANFYNLKVMTFSNFNNVDRQGEIFAYSNITSTTSGNYLYRLEIGDEVIGLKVKQS